jgi:hypothetical protein
MPDPFPKRSEVIYRGATTVTVNNSAAETEIAGFNMPPAVVWPTRALRLQMQGLYLQNGGLVLGSDPLIRLKLGTTTLWTSPALWLPSLRSISATQRQTWIQVFLSNPSSGQVQHVNIWLWMDGLGQGTFGVPNLSVNTAQQQRFSITWQFPTARNNLRFDSFYRIGEIV